MNGKKVDLLMENDTIVVVFFTVVIFIILCGVFFLATAEGFSSDESMYNINISTTSKPSFLNFPAYTKINPTQTVTGSPVTASHFFSSQSIIREKWRTL